MSDLSNWVYEQRMNKWRNEHFATTASVTTHFVLQLGIGSNHMNSILKSSIWILWKQDNRQTQGDNLAELLLQRQPNRQPVPQLRNAKARVPSVWKRVFAELIG